MFLLRDIFLNKKETNAKQVATVQAAALIVVAAVREAFLFRYFVKKEIQTNGSLSFVRYCLPIPLLLTQ